MLSCHGTAAPQMHWLFEGAQKTIIVLHYVAGECQRHDMLMRLIKADGWHMKAEHILRSHVKSTGDVSILLVGWDQ